jgi:uncharacterized protein (DUF1330 family)
MAVYLIGAIDIHDQERYTEYISGAGGSIVGTAIQPLAVDDDPILLEGTIPGRRVVLIKFESEDAMRRWYSTEPYRSAKDIRHRSATTNFLIAVRGLDSI